MSKLNSEVSHFIKARNHPQESLINTLRKLVLSSHADLVESIKWNGPNYSINSEDRITMRIEPPTKLELIFHRGAKVQNEPKSPLIKDPEKLLIFKTNDRAVLTIKDSELITKHKEDIKSLIADWIKTTNHN